MKFGREWDMAYIAYFQNHQHRVRIKVAHRSWWVGGGGMKEVVGTDDSAW